jgi:hypothetical protein
MNEKRNGKLDQLLIKVKTVRSIQKEYAKTRSWNISSSTVLFQKEVK